MTVTLANGLAQDTITHWHGLVTNFQNDGGPLLSIAPGQTFDYNFQINQRAGLNFYHPHPHMLTGEQVCLGLAGAFIVRDAEEDTLALPSGPYEVPLVIRDASFDRQGNMIYNPSSSGFNGKYPVVNGTLRPMMNVDRGVYRFRVLNGANARVFRLALTSGAPFVVIGNDGGLLRAPATATSIELGTGERLDLLVDFSSLGAGQSVTLRCSAARWDLLRFVGTGAAGVAYAPPATLSVIEPLVGPAIQDRRQCAASRPCARRAISGGVSDRRPEQAVSLGERLEGYRAAERQGNGRHPDSLRCIQRRIRRPVRDALPSARARKHGDDDEFHGRLTGG